jgi:uncharacterized membrane protein
VKVKSFTSAVDHERVVAAIKEAEARSSGEIRVHVSTQSVDDPEKAAAAVFERLGMAKTGLRNGVLIFIAPSSQKFAVIGDKAIHERCGSGFWSEVAHVMSDDFRAGKFTEGILDGVHAVGEQLARHFPRDAGGPADTNELSDEVSHD